jgi:hypothetical protein
VFDCCLVLSAVTAKHPCMIHIAELEAAHFACQSPSEWDRP